MDTPTTRYLVVPPVSEFRGHTGREETLLEAFLAAFWTVVFIGSIMGGAIAIGERDTVDVKAPRFVQVQP
jgi:hypothetical protein